jgi:hypothetical protein
VAADGGETVHDDRSHARLVDGAAWQDFCDVLAQAGTMVDRFDDVSDLERAEWYRFVTRLLRVGLERFVENHEPARPRLRDTPWRTSINVQSPDQDHLLAEFDASHEYVITGNRGTTPYFVLGVWSANQPPHPGAHAWAPQGLDGLESFDPALLQTTAHLSSDDITFDAAGDFRIHLGGEPRERDWLALRDDTVGMLVRVVHHRRGDEIPPSFVITRLDGAAPMPITPTLVGDGLATAAQSVLAYTQLVRSWWVDNFSKRPNDLRYSAQTYLSNGGVADRHFAFGAWHKPDDMALVLEFAPPECEHWIFQLCNIWQENLDNYEDGQGYVTKFTAHPEPDGTVRVLVADRDPGIGANFVASHGHTRGLMGLRLIKTDAPPPVRVWLIPLATLQRDRWASLAGTDARLTGELTQ